MKIYIMRHGQTDWNKAGRLQGRSDTDLNEHGKQLARLTGEALKGLPFSCIFTSPLKRARETALLAVGERAENIPVIADPRLLEICFGTYEGTIPDAAFLDVFFHHPERYQAPPGGETLDQVETRTADFLSGLYHRQDLQEKTILVSTHGCAMRGLMNSVSKNSREHYWGMQLTPNCGVSLIVYEYGKARIEWENRTFYEKEV